MMHRHDKSFKNLLLRKMEKDKPDGMLKASVDRSWIDETAPAQLLDVSQALERWRIDQSYKNGL